MSRFSTRRKFLQNACVIASIPWTLSAFKLPVRRDSPRIGYINGAGLPELEEAFKKELETLGYIENQNIQIESRHVQQNAGGIDDLVDELLKSDLSLIVAGALPFAMAVRAKDPNMPMVIATCPGMVTNGFANSLEHPGGIYTGIDELPEGVTTKRMQLLKKAAPSVTRLALLSTTPGKGGHEIQASEAEKTARELGIETKIYRAMSLTEIQKTLPAIISDGMNGLLNFQGGLSLANRAYIVETLNNNRIPAIYQATMFAQAGGLMTWAPDLSEQLRECARFVSKILKGSKPGDLSIRYPTGYKLTINKTTAKRIGVTFSKELIAEAKLVIES